MRVCAACHGYQDAQGYEFKGETLGQVEPNAALGVDPHRLDSYTERFRAIQLTEFFKGTEYQFKAFKKTDGYANAPLDGLWLRAPYLHNGAVPTLADLLEPPEKRPATFIRGIDTLDAAAAGLSRRRAIPRRYRRAPSALTRASPETAIAAIAMAPTCRRTRSPTCSPICLHSEPRGPLHEPDRRRFPMPRTRWRSACASTGYCF